MPKCFRPLTGISLFLLSKEVKEAYKSASFSSPHGDFSFSIGLVPDGRPFLYRFRPLTGISLFLYRLTKQLNKSLLVFVPSRGFLFFYKDARIAILNLVKFSSPHGDFSFSIVLQDSRTQFNNWFSSPHGDFSFSISDTVFGASPRTQVFVPSRGFLFFYVYVVD